MSFIAINTTQNIQLEYELAGVGDRVVARILDWLFIIGYFIICWAIIGFGGLDTFFENNLFLFIIMILPIVFYDLVFEIVMNGQSPGKKIMAIKVISLNGEQPSISQYLIRWLFRIVDFSIAGGLVALILVAATQKSQRLGDLVAGTTVVRIKARTAFQQTLYVPTVDTNYVVTYPEVINLKESDIQLLKEILATSQKNKNAYLAFEAARKIEDVLKIKMQGEASHFLYTVIADYNHLAAKQ